MLHPSFFFASRDDGVWAKAYFIFIVFDGRWSFYAVVTVLSRWVNSEGLNHRKWSWRGRHKEKRSTEHVRCDHTSTKAPDPIKLNFGVLMGSGALVLV